MKKIYLLYTLFILCTIHAQIDQNLNKTSEVVLNPITQIDSIRFGNSQTMQVVLRNGGIINHAISEINNVTFSMPSYPGGAGNCNGYPTAVVEVLNPITGKKWMDRNLGASRVATNITDALAYGDLYQWGRGTDGHQCRSSMAYSPSNNQNTDTDNPSFYIGNIWISGLFVIPQPWLTDWRNPKKDALWQGQFSATNSFGSPNNPCPLTYRLPTASELDAERLSWTSNNSIGAFNSALKFTVSGRRIGTQGTQPLPYFNGVGLIGAYWSSTIDNNNSSLLYFDSSSANVTSGQRANGLSVRCIKAKGSLNTLWCNLGGNLNVTHFGNLTQGVVADGVITKTTVIIGNYGSYDSLSVPSTGVTGLTANLAAGDFSSGTTTQLTFIISGTPNGYGIANFSVTIDGQTCSFSRTVDQGVVSSLNCNSAIINTNLTKNIAVSNSSFTIPYTGGNGGYYYSNIAQSTGVTGITAILAAGNLANGNGTLTYTLSGTPLSAGTANFLINFGTQTCVISCPVYPNPGSIQQLNCGGVSSTGILTIGIAASGVISNIPYTGGDGGFYSSQTVNSTGVTGLTATLASGNFNVGSGNLTYNVSGTPTSSGMANFALNIGGQTCNLTLNVNVVANISTLNCLSATNNGTLIASTSANGVSSSIPYTGGNGVPHYGQIVTSTGVTGLTATLSQGILSNGSGTLTYTITGTPSSFGTANFALNIGGKTCTLSRDVISSISLNCSSATNNGYLTVGQIANGVNSTVPYTNGNGDAYNGQTVNSTGIIGLTANLQPGTLTNGSGNLVYNITGTPTSSGTAIFTLNLGGQICELSRTVYPIVSVSSLWCNSVAIYGSVTAFQNSNGISFAIPYQGSNGGIYDGQIINSTGITGLTATLPAGVTYYGGGALIFNLTGTPTSSGTAYFSLNFGGQSCEISITVNPGQPPYPAGSVFCNSSNTPTLVVDITNPITGKTWMDRNLGANQAAANSDDVNAYGDLYQWGRRSDGHQCRTSTTTTTLSSIDQPLNGSFIISNSSPRDWRSPQNTNLWQGVNGINNPCPSTYRLPNNAELDAERLSWSSNSSFGAIASPLKLPNAGIRYNSNGTISGTGSAYYGLYWSSTISGTNSKILNFWGYLYGNSPNALLSDKERANGASVRCIKN